MDRFDAGRLNTMLRIERKSVTRDAYGAENPVAWLEVATVFAWVRDVLLWNNAETSDSQLRQLTRPTRVVIRYREGIESDMRATILDRNRVMQIISIAEMGTGDGLELICADYSTDGQ